MSQHVVLGPRVRVWGALFAAAAALAVGRPAYAQRPVIFQGRSPVVTKASATVNGVPSSTALLATELQALNNPSYLVLFPNGVVGYVPSNLSALGLPSVPALYGSWAAAPGGMIQLGGSTTFTAGTDSIAAYVNGFVFVYQGKFYALLNYAGVIKSTGTTEVDTATFLVPLTLISS